MIIKVLVENTAASGDFGCEHGLSLYLETGDRKILFDVGAGELFLENARKLGVSIPDVDALVISHGHGDHGGGLRAFLRENTRAAVFLHPLAFGKHYARRPNGALEWIGLEEELKESKQMVFTSGVFSLYKGIQVFSDVPQNNPLPAANKGLLVERRGRMTQDLFAHEQNLILEEGGTSLLVTGCAHNGIVNILEHVQTLKGRMPDYVMGGFHLSGRSAGNESAKAIEAIGSYLMGTKVRYDTCHCTGAGPYRQLKAMMGDRIGTLSAGDTIIISSKRGEE